MTPQLILCLGCMFSGKTSLLFSYYEKFKYQKKNILVVKPESDNRYSMTEIRTHSGIKIPALSISKSQDLENLIHDSNSNTVIIDEFFMIPGISKIMENWFRKGITIVGASLDLSSELQPFQEVKDILPFATLVHKCTAVCTVCQNDAMYTMAKFDKHESVVVGGSDKYEPRCHIHHPHMWDNK